MKRTFIAVPVEASENYLRLTGCLRDEFRNEQIKWVDPANIHITLQFLGETPERMISSVCETLAFVAENHYAMEGKMAGLGTFTVNRKPSVLFSQLTELPVLAALADEAGSRLEIQGFVLEKRKFRPHLTLARIKYLKDTARFNSVVGQYQNTFIQNVKADKVIYFESILLPGGPVYKPLMTIQLKTQADQPEAPAISLFR